MTVLLKAGAVIERDEQRPGRPVIAVDLNYTGAGDSDLEALKAFPELRVVKLRECYGMTPKGMSCLAGLTHLQELDLATTGVRDEGLTYLESLTNLQTLILTWDHDITDDGLRHLRGLTNLRHLDLCNCYKITDKGLAHLTTLKHLRHLNLGSTVITDAGLAYLRNMPKLDSLSLAWTKISNTGLARVGERIELRSLDLGHTGIGDEGLAHLKTLRHLRNLNIPCEAIRGESLNHLRGLTELRSLTLGWNVSGEALTDIGGMTQLHELCLVLAHRITDRDMAQLGRLAGLEKLELFHLSAVTDKGLEPLKKLTNLRTLELRRMDGVTDNGLRHVKGLTKLRELRLLALDHIGDAGLEDLKGLSELCVLELNCRGITDNGLAVLSAFPRLEILQLRGDGFTDAGLQHVESLVRLRELHAPAAVNDAGMFSLTGLNDLRTLNLSRTRITNRALGPLMALPALRTLVVEDSQVTDAGVANFRAARPRTKVIQYTIKQTMYVPSGDEETSRGLAPLVRLLAKSDDPALQLDVLRGMHEALQGRRNVAAPEGWSAVHRKLSASDNAEVRPTVLQLSVLFGAPQALAELRKTVADTKADAAARRRALQTLVEKRPPDLLPLLRRLVRDSALRGSAIRALAGYDDAETPPLLLDQYASFPDAEKADAVATLASRPKYALALLDAVEKGRVPRRDLSAFTARQLLALNDRRLTERLTQVWGTVRPPSREKTELLTKYRAMVPADALKKADRKHGRLLFTRTCATCHTLFGEGGKIGPDLTGSQRTNPDYLLAKLIEPSAVVARDYQMTVVTTKSGRTVSGLVKEESDKTLTLQTPNEVVRLDKADIDERNRSPLSLMPDGLLMPLNTKEVRDLIAYLSGSGQVSLPP